LLRSEKDSLNSQVIHKGASLAESKDKVATKSKEIKVLQSKLKALEKNYSSAQMNLSEMDSLRLELERAKADLFSKKYELECVEKGIEAKDIIYKRVLDDLSSARLKLSEKDRLLRELELKKNNEVDHTLPPMNDLSQPFPTPTENNQDAVHQEEILEVPDPPTLK
jgi:predicted  nucleic acid-binding Zn-ribbon protein